MLYRPIDRTVSRHRVAVPHREVMAQSHHRRPMNLAAVTVALVVAVAAQIAFPDSRRVVEPAPVPGLYPDDEALNFESIAGQTLIVNFWASWCIACRGEHRLLERLSKRNDLTIVGINSQDRRDDALRWLRYFGDPYCRSAYDESGAAADALGVQGLPTTLVIDANGAIRYRHVGPLSDIVLEEEILPVVNESSARAVAPACRPAASGPSISTS